MSWHILIVEDDPDGREVVQRVLRYHQIGTDVVGSAEAALEQLAATRYDACIIDLALPGMDGWSLMQQIRRTPATADTPCIAITAFHTPELAQKAIVDGFAAYFPKPLEATGFVRELERVLAQPR